MLKKKKKKIGTTLTHNRGTTIAKIVSENTVRNPTLFEPRVNMWVHEELIEGRKLTDIINESHENVKYVQ